MVMSSDVLEHVPPEKVPMVAARMARLTRGVLIIKVASKVEADRVALHKVMADERPHAHALHATVRPLRRWLRAFERIGFELATKLTPDTAVLSRCAASGCVHKPDAVRREHLTAQQHRAAVKAATAAARAIAAAKPVGLGRGVNYARQQLDAARRTKVRVKDFIRG